MRILVTGSHGQLGRDFQKTASEEVAHHCFFTDVEDLDIQDKKQIDEFVQRNKIDVVVNCAAYTAVDKAEKDVDAAYALNALAVENLAKSSIENNFFLLHFSTDYVFSGKAWNPKKEEDETGPSGAYGKTKLAGEKMVERWASHAAIIRTSWLYSEHGNNFVKTMLRLGAEKEQLSVVFDQVGTPTYSMDLARAIWVILNAKERVKGVQIYHYSNEGVCSWYDFALEIMKMAALSCKIKPVETKDYPTPTERPAYSVLNKNKIKEAFEIEIPHWRESLKKMYESFR